MIFSRRLSLIFLFCSGVLGMVKIPLIFFVDCLVYSMRAFEYVNEKNTKSLILAMKSLQLVADFRVRNCFVDVSFLGFFMGANNQEKQ
jgi:hypothetical protein